MESMTRISPDRRVLRELSNVKPEPVSPTANLRLLTTLASNLKSAPQQDKNQSKTVNKRNITPSKEAADTDPFKSLPRKEKSLGLLCNRFLSLYPLSQEAGNSPHEISLDITAKALGTEKRRIYDIINVLESLEMASKAGKNRYLWRGHSCLPGTLAKLKSLAVKIGLREQIQEIQRINRAYVTGNFTSDQSPYLNTPVSQSSSNYEYSLSSYLPESNSKEDKSLGVMCQKFIMLFLVSLKNGVINLDIAAKVLITDNSTDQSIEIPDTSIRSRFKTKVRRLYDIANVLTAIGLIKKVSMPDSSIRKPIFKYTGPDVDYIDFDAETPIQEGTRHSLIGMATPSRSFTYSFLPQSSSTTLADTPNRLLIGSTTPITKRREPRKRKLFGTDEKFGRTMSSPCLDVDRPSLDRLDDSILQVAEMELEKLKSCEQPKSKACVKLFPRHNSESCVSETQVSGELSSIFLDSLRAPECSIIENIHFVNSMKRYSSESSSNIYDNKKVKIANYKKSLMTVGDENLVDKSTASNAINNNIQISELNSPFQQHNLPVLKAKTNLNPASSGVQPKNNTNMKTLKLKVRDSNIITIMNTASKKFIVRDISSDNPRTGRIAPCNIQPKISTPKFVSLANFDAKKLIPIKPSDFKVTTPSLKPIILENQSPINTSYAILTQVQTPTLSPGDLFKAVQVGNTLQLVPIRSQNSIDFNNKIDNQNTANSNS